MRGVTAGLLTFLLYFIAQAGVFHFIKVSRRAVVLVGLWLVGLGAYVWVYARLPEDVILWPAPLQASSDWVTEINGALLYFFLFMGYAQFFYMAESSVGVRTMIELASRPDQGYTLQELTVRYRSDWMLQRRLDRMIHAGYLVADGDYYAVTKRGEVVAWVLSRFKSLLRLGPGG